MELETELNLETVKKVTQQVKSYGFENYSIPLFEWRLMDVFKGRSEDDEFTLQSEVFPLAYYNYLAHLTLAHSPTQPQWQLTLHLERFDQDPLSRSKQFLSLPFFVCKCLTHVSVPIDSPKKTQGPNDTPKTSSGPNPSTDAPGPKYTIKTSQRSFLSSDVFSPKLHKQQLRFRCHVFDTNTVIGVYQEPEAACHHVSPFARAAVGRIEKFSEERERLAESQSLVVSPRFNFGPFHQLMIVRFWYANMDPALKEKGLSATLHFLDRSEPHDFTFVATFTLFSQKAHKTDLEKKLVLRRDANKYCYPLFLAFYEELEDYLDKDTLYYKITVEQFN